MLRQAPGEPAPRHHHHLRAELAGEGWIQRGKRDYCEVCSKRLDKGGQVV
jgi:hypothetical protein